MPIIHELPNHLADLIAAGEVVERPASVVKELIENAIDAGSTRITVEIECGGITYLRIMDDGCGMSAEDAPIAFRRHATSKLHSKEDLSSIGTLGFRGEALAATASVSHIDLFTKQADTLAGIHLHLDAGEITQNEEAGCPNGTTIIVRDLFYNMPARMKFLKKDFTEAGYVVDVVEHAALSHPEISFTMIRDGRQVFSTSGNGKLIGPVFTVFGKELSANLIELDRMEQNHLAVWGYITKPYAGRANRSMQHFFVNGRYVKSRVMQAALEEAYRNQIMTGKYPSAALFLSVPLHLVDVNVHPAKIEVKFADEKTVFDIIYAACRGVLNQESNTPQIRPNTSSVHQDQQTVLPVMSNPSQSSKKENDPSSQQDHSSDKKTEKYPVVDTYRVMGKTIKVRSVYKEPPNTNLSLQQVRPKHPYVEADELDWDYLPQFMPQVQKETENLEIQQAVLGGAHVLGEAFHAYIIAEDEKGLILIDKHAAHERIIFNRLRSQVEISQQILVQAQVIEVTPTEFSVLCDHLEHLRKLGFDLDVFGQRSFVVRAIPNYLENEDLTNILSEMADKLMNNRVPLPDRLDDLIHVISCKAAIKAGMHTPITELQDFCNRVLNDPDVISCPHGRPVIVRFSRYELDKLFKRVNP